MQDFETIEALDEETKNSISTLALSAVASYGFENLDDGVTLSLLQNTARIIYVEREGKGLGVYDFLKYLKETDPVGYQGFVTPFSPFSPLKDKLKSKLNTVEISDIDKESYSIMLTAVVFGYSSIYSSVSDFWESFNANQKSLFPKELLSRANLDSVFDSDYVKMRLSIINSESSVDSIINLLKYINVESLFTGEAVNAELMKDSEIQSYRISGKVNYFYGFDPSIVDCEQIEVDEATGFRVYPCNRVSVKPRALQFNQIITDGPYSRGGPSVADNGIKLLTSIKSSYYDSSRIEDVKILNGPGCSLPPCGPFFASYNSGWVFDEFSGERPVNLRGDVGFANSADTLKSFPDGAETGQYHFLGSYTFTTGAGVGQISKYSGFNPILLRLNDKDEQRIYSQLEVNLFDKQKRSGQLMAYAVSTDKDILTSFSTGETSQYPLLSIANHTPSIPFIGINLEFSSKTFNKKPAAKFNFGSLYFVPETASNPGGSFTKATNFSFTGFNFTGDYFALSKGSIKFDKEIKNTSNFNPESAITNEKNENGPVYPQPGEMLFQKALGFSNYKDCITKVESVETGFHYGVEYKFIGDLRPPEIEDEENKYVKRVGDTGVLKYVTGFGPAGNISPLLSKTVFGPLDSNTDQGLDGKDFNYKYLPGNYKAEELSYARVPALNPARYYSGLFASERRQFLYPSAKKIHDKNRYFPSQVKLSFMVEEEYSKSANGSLSRYGADIQKTTGELSGYWIDQNFSPPNRIVCSPGGCVYYYTYNPLTNSNLNPHYQYLAGGVSISDGELNQENLSNYLFDRIEQADTALLYLPNTPIESNLKESYSFDIELNYNLPIKSLSDFLNHPKHSNKSFISTGDSEITINQETQTGSVSYVTGWTAQINIDVNNGCDPLFNPGGFSARIPLDNNENISGDSWNGFYLKSGTVVYPYGPGAPPPYRATEDDKILVEASDNSSNLRLFLRKLKLFPTFVNNDQDKSYGSGNSFVEDSLSSLRQADNFIGSRIFEINSDSILNSIPIESSSKEVSSFTKNISLNQLIEKDITRTGKLYYAPADGSVILPELSAKEYQKIADLYPQLHQDNGYKFYSGVDAHARMNSGYYIKYTESSNLKLTITSAEVKYDRFPASDELFEFHLTGKANFSGALSYFTQEEPCIVTHGIKIEEKINALDKLQSDESRFSHASPILKDKLGSISTFSFPTRQIRRRSRIISGQNTFINVNSSSPDYNNHFHMSVTPEFVYLSNESSILGSFSQDHLLFPNASMINSSSYDYVDVFPNGEEYRMDKVDKIYEVVESKRFYDSFFSDSKLNSGEFVEFLPTGASVNSNKDLESFFAANFSKISDLKLGEEDNNYITKMEDRSSDVSKLRSSMLTGA